MHVGMHMEDFQGFFKVFSKFWLDNAKINILCCQDEEKIFLTMISNVFYCLIDVSSKKKKSYL